MSFISISIEVQNCIHVIVINALERLYYFYRTSIEFMCNFHGISTDFPCHFYRLSIEISLQFPLNWKWISEEFCPPPPVTYKMIRISIEISRKYKLTDFYRISMEWASRYPCNCNIIAVELLCHFYRTSIDFLCNFYGISTEFPLKFLQNCHWIGNEFQRNLAPSSI